MNIEDVDVVNAERDSSPTRFHSYDTNDHFPATYERVHDEFEARSHGGRSRSRRSRRSSNFAEAREEPVEEVEEAPAHSHRGPHGTRNETGSVSSSNSSVSGIQQEGIRGQAARQRHMSTISKSSTKMERDLMDYLDRHPTAVGRVEQHRLQHMQTVGSAKVSGKEGYVLPDFGGGKPYPPELPEREEYVVEFSGHDDPRHAQNFKFSEKILIASILVFDSLAATFASSIFSAGTVVVGEEFHVGREVVTLGTSLFVLGYAVGPLVFGPLSELYGRRVPIIIAAFGFSIFNTAVAVAKDYQTLVISRFFAGVFGACPLTLCGAVFADMFDNKVRRF